MFVIDNGQLTALRISALEPVRAKFIKILRRKLPFETTGLSDSALHLLCDKGIVTASKYGMGTEYNVYLYVATMLLLGEDFDTGQKTACQEILREERMPEDVKGKLLQLRVLIDTGTDISPHGR